MFVEATKKKKKTKGKKKTEQMIHNCEQNYERNERRKYISEVILTLTSSASS
jgi:hypothetical protein